MPRLRRPVRCPATSPTPARRSSAPRWSGLVADEGLHLDVATGGELHVALQRRVPAGPDRVPRQQQVATTSSRRRSTPASAGSSPTPPTSSTASTPRRGPRPPWWYRPRSGAAPACSSASRPGSRRTRTSSSRPAPRRRSSGSRSRAGSRATPRCASRRVTALRFAGLHCHIGSQIYRLDSYARAVEIVAGLAAEIARATGDPVEELNFGGGLGARYLADDPALDVADYATIAARAPLERSRGRHGTRRRCRGSWSSRAARSRPVRDHALPGRDGQGDPGHRHLRRGRRRDERQPPPGALRRGLRGVPPRPDRRGRARSSARSSASTASRATSSSPARTCRRASRSATSSPLRRTGAYGYSMASNYNKVPRPAVVFVRDGSPARRRPPRDARRPRPPGRGVKPVRAPSARLVRPWVR